MKTKIIKPMLWALIFAFASSALSGCGIFPLIKDYEEYCDGECVYIIDSSTAYSGSAGHKFAAIIGFIYEGGEEEVIDVPRTLGGVPVRYIGYTYKTSVSGRPYHIKVPPAEKIKVYLHDNIEYIYQEAFYDFADKELEVMLCNAVGSDRTYSHLTNTKHYVYKFIYDGFVEKFRETYSDYPELVFNPDCHWANITFKNNYSDEVNGGYYRLDNIEEGETVPLPPAPEREGYDFVGWYTEPACLNVWDFSVAPSLPADSDFILYAGWRAK